MCLTREDRRRVDSCDDGAAEGGAAEGGAASASRGPLSLASGGFFMNKDATGLPGFMAGCVILRCDDGCCDGCNELPLPTRALLTTDPLCCTLPSPALALLGAGPVGRGGLALRLAADGAGPLGSGGFFAAILAADDSIADRSQARSDHDAVKNRLPTYKP